MRTAREIIAGALDEIGHDYDELPPSEVVGDIILAALAAEGFSIVETGLVERAFRDGVAYGTVCDVTDVDKAWETSAVRARSTREGKTE